MVQKRIILKIFGKVQGVFFRTSSRMKARELNLVGFAKNEPDGTVGIVAEGEEENLKRFIEWCKSGLDQAKVENIEIQWVEPIGEFGDFVVK